MKIVHAAVALILLAPLAACDPGGVELETRTFRLEALEPQQAGEMVEPYVYRGREGNPGMMTVTEGALTVRETEDNLERIARVLEEFDRAPGELRLRFQVVEANGAGASDPAIAEVEEELRRLFRFEGYELVAEGAVSVAPPSRFTQRLLGEEGEWFVEANVFDRGGAAVHLAGVQLWSSTDDMVIETSVNVRPGHTLVLGSGPGRGGEGAVILIVQAERTPVPPDEEGASR